MPEPQNAEGTSSSAQAPQPDLSGLRFRTLQQAKSEVPQPQITPPWEEEPELPSSSAVGQAYEHAKGFLDKWEGKLSDKVLAPFRSGLDSMAEDLQQAGESGHTKSGGRLTEPARALASGVGTLLKQVPVGSNVKETALMSLTPPELPQAKGLSKEINLEGVRSRQISKPLQETTVPNLEGLRTRQVSPALTIAAKELPPQPRLPDTGTHAAIKTDDGSIYFDANPEKQRTHIMLAKDLGIPPERVVSGGWLTDGEYEGNVRSDAGKWGEQARAQAAVAEKRSARSQTEQIETLYHGSPDVSKIDSLKPGKRGGYFGDGIYLSRDRDVAHRFTKLESMNPTLEPNADGSFTDINTGKRVPAGKPGVLETTLKNARLKEITIDQMDAEIEKFRQPSGVIDLDAARNAVAEKYAKQGYDGFDVPATKYFNEPQVVLFPRSAQKLSINKPSSTEFQVPAITAESKAKERAANLKGLGIGLTKMDPEDAKNWVGFTNQKTIKVYRGVSDPAHTIEPGDFVTTSKESAQNYGKHVQEIEVSPEELRYVRGHKDGNPRLLDQGGQTELIYAPKRKAGSSQSEQGPKKNLTDRLFDEALAKLRPESKKSAAKTSVNASGESSASLEAQSRLNSEKNQGMKRFRVDTRSGNEIPLFGVDAIDAKAGPYEKVIMRGPKGETVLDRGVNAR